MSLLLLIRSCPDYLKNFFKYQRYISFKSESSCREIFYDIRTFFKFIKNYFYGENYSNSSNVFFDITIDDLGKIDSSVLEKFIFFLANDLNNSPLTRNRKLYSIKILFKYLYENRLISYDYSRNIRCARSSKKRLPKTLSLNETNDLLYNILVTDKEFMIRNYCITNLVLNTGIRVGELSKINLNDINLFDRTLKIKGKGNKERIVYLNNSSVEALEEYLKVRPTLKNNNFHYHALFISKQMKRLSKRSMQYIVKEELKAINKPDFSVHKLRNTYITLLYNNLIKLKIQPNISILSKILGHSSTSSLDHYLGFSNSNLKEKMLRFNILCY